MPLNLTSSVVVARALRLQPEGERSPEAATCAFCGLHIGHGDARAPFSAGASFTDDSSLAARGSTWICGHCAALTTQEGLRQSGHGVFSDAGMRPFRKWADISAALIDPPQGPFVMVHATRNNQHMAWRAPVNFSRECLNFCVRGAGRLFHGVGRRLRRTERRGGKVGGHLTQWVW